MLICICDYENYISNLVSDFLPSKNHAEQTHFTKTLEFFWINWTTELKSDLLKKWASSTPKMQQPDK